MPSSPALFSTRAFRLSALAFGVAVGVTLTACSTTPPPAAPVSAGPAPSAEPLTLRVMAFNDFHGHLESGGATLTLRHATEAGQTVRLPVGGAAALAGLVQALRADAPHHVLVSSGDMIGASPLVSALFRHESTLEVMNRIGVDVATVGNHEFDAGEAELQRLIRGGCERSAPADAPVQSCVLGPYPGSAFPWIVSNVERADGTPLLAKTWVKQVGPVKVGFIGAVTRSTPQMVVPSGVAGLRFTPEAEAVNRAAAELKQQGIEAMVLTLHEGGDLGSDSALADWNGNRCQQLRGAVVDIARQVTPDVDLILTGHTHQGYNCVVQGRPVMQASPYGRGLSVVDLTLNPATRDVDRSRTVARNLPVPAAGTATAQRQAVAAGEPLPFARALLAAQPVTAVAEQVQRYAQAAAPRAQRVVGRIGGTFDRRGSADTAAGRLVADAQWEATREPARGGAQFALMNPGGVRSDLACRGNPPCEVPYGDAFTMQPFGNSLVVMTLTGAQIKTLLENQQRPQRANPSFLSPSAGLSYRWRRGAPYGQRVDDLRLNGQPIQPEADYRVTVNSFMADGGDGLSVFRQGRDRVGGAQDVDALTDYLSRRTPAPSEARVQVVD